MRTLSEYRNFAGAGGGSRMYNANTLTDRPMNLQSAMTNTKGRRRRGFSLVTTITIMVLLSLIAIGLLSLSTITLRSSTSELAQLEAQSNARLALMVAIGELQTHLGPDQRVSAEAGVLDKEPDPYNAAGIQGIKHPHWVGVWSTEWVPPGSDGINKSPWVRDDVEGGLSDQRFTGAAGRAFDRETDILSYLISGNEGGRAELGVDLIEAEAWEGDQIELVGDGTVATTEEHVVAPRVSTRNDKDLVTGGYAYWVGDLGVRANVAMVDAYSLDSPVRGPNPDGMERLLNPQDTAAKQLDGINNDLTDEEVRKLFSRKTVELTDGVPSRENAVRKKRAFHHLTTQSKAVLCNVRQGGLLRDLTAYIHDRRGTIRDLRADGRIVSQGINDLDNMIGPANAAVAREQGTTWGRTKYRDIAPTFALVRNWALAGRGLQYAERDTNMVDPAPPTPEDIANGTLRGMNDGVNVYDGGNLRPASFLPFVEPNLFPVMTEASVYYNLATYPESAGPGAGNVLRVCIYPRVALWNPYNVAINTHNMCATVFVNGNKDVRVSYADRSAPKIVPIPFGRGSTKIPNGAQARGPDPSPGHYVGWMLLSLQPTTIQPGETLVFSPRQHSEYQLFDVARNVLSASVAPDPSIYFWQDMRVRDTSNRVIHTSVPRSFIEFPGPGNQSGGDNYMMSLKSAGRARSFNDSSFNSMQSIVYANTSLQAGGSDELPVQWSSGRGARVPEPRVHQLANSRARLPGTAIPDTRTRDGFRIRWWDEHRSNVLGSGQLRGQPQHLKTSVLGTWNPRAAYFCRNPWDNVTDLPPHFYGMYTRDLFDQRVSWQNMMPRSVDGRNVSWPFGEPLEAPDDGVVLFDVPREEIGIPSLGYLRHLKLSEFGWHPSYAVGNSLVDPRVGRLHTSPVLRTSQEKRNNGWNQYLFGHGGGRTSGRGPDYWAMLTRQILFNRPDDHFVVYDLSYEANFNLWDNFFVSTGNPARKQAFVRNPEENPLPNGRFQLIGTGTDVDRDVVDFHRAASQLWLNGGFNVNSVSVDAWKAVLASAMNAGNYASEDAIPFPRVINPPNGEYLGGNWDDEEATSGFLSIDGSDATDSELERLAQEIVREVKERAPFFGLSDFINRRLVASEHGDAGPIEAAIQRSGINAEFDENELLRIPNAERDRLRNVSFDNMRDATRLEQTQKPNSVAWGLPGYLTQGDVVQAIGSALRPRSDSFIVRAYGESVDVQGEVKARAWCEAIVQRSPEPINPDSSGLNPMAKRNPDDLEFGRRFKLVSFRWLNAEEV